jgi:hypothetical protein
MQALAPHRPSYIRLPLGWPGEPCDFKHPRDYIGFDGAAASAPARAWPSARRLRYEDPNGCPLRCWATAIT